jgi:hypothetical protein
MANGDGQVVFSIDLDDTAFQAGLKHLQSTLETFCSGVLSAFTLSAAQAEAAYAAGGRWAAYFASGILQGNAATVAAQRVVNTASGAAKTAGYAGGIGVGQGMVNGIIAGASSRGGALNAALMRIVRNALAAAKRAAGISSPSALFRDEVGRYLALGVQTGFTDTMSQTVLPAIGQSVASGATTGRQALSGSLLASVQRSFSPQLTLPDVSRVATAAVNGSAAKTGAAAVSGGDSIANVTQNITFEAASQAPDELARAIRRQTTYGLAAARG